MVAQYAWLILLDEGGRLGDEFFDLRVGKSLDSSADGGGKCKGIFVSGSKSGLIPRFPLFTYSVSLTWLRSEHGNNVDGHGGELE